MARGLGAVSKCSFLLLLWIFFLANPIYSQQSCEKQLTILDKNEHYSVDGYAINRRTGRFSFKNEQGQIYISGMASDTVLFTCLGYYARVMILGDCTDTILLSQEVLELQEVTVVDDTNHNEIEMGNTKDKLSCQTLGFVKQTGDNDRIGLLLENHFTGYLGEVSFYVTDESTTGSRFRINIYLRRGSEFELIYISNTKSIECEGCWHTTDLSSSNILVSRDFLVVVEWLFSTVEVKHYVENRFPIGFGIGMSKNKHINTCNTYAYDRKAGWFRSCCATEDGNKTPFNLVLSAKLRIPN